MKPAPFSFTRPSDLTEALSALAADPHAKVLAGGQSLIPLLSMRLAAPSALVDINGLSELAYVRSDETGVRVGALARHADVLADAAAVRVQPLIAQALRMVAHATIRNRGTTVGSIVHADAAAEMPVVLLLLGGSVTAASTGGKRTVPAEELYVGPLETTLRPDEIATEVFFPALPADGGTAFDEISRRHGDYALCGVGAVVRTDEAGRVTSARAGYLSVSEVPTVVDLTEALGGATTGATTGVTTGATTGAHTGGDGGVSEAALDAAADLADAALDPEGDIHATADYRRHLARVLTRRVVRRALDDSSTRRSGGPA